MAGARIQVLREHNVLALNYLAQHVTSSRLHIFHLYSHQEGKQCRNLYFLPSSLAAFSLQPRQLSLKMLPRCPRPAPATSSFWTRMVFRRLPSRLSATPWMVWALAIPLG